MKTTENMTTADALELAQTELSKNYDDMIEAADMEVGADRDRLLRLADEIDAAHDTLAALTDALPDPEDLRYGLTAMEALFGPEFDCNKDALRRLADALEGRDA